ncbi:hypothetical protein [Flavobacterium sp.]|uniref:hypothetical protein n=1 Tax=Flavobacterium sp. TaxID=239 RepID=UPI0024875BC5|nr:hypothetical protein [Flavobacterium sp.]MDI1317898.1 hypothetical protein [Flavobacterium sp.]
MKKILLLGVLLHLSTISFGQINLGTYYGTTGTLGLDLTYHKKYIIGIGGSFSVLESKTIGEDYTDNDYTSSFSDQIIESTVEEKIYSIYAVGGYRYKRITFIGKLGYGAKGKYNNYFDPDQVFGNQGYYYKKIDESGSLLIGSNIGVSISKKISLFAGYDNYNEATIGIGYEFN